MFRSLRAIVLAALIGLTALPLAAAGLLFEKSEYAARRARLMEAIPDGAAILLGAQPVTGLLALLPE